MNVEGEPATEDDHEPVQQSGRRTTSYGFAIDSTRIRSVPLAEQSAALQRLGIDVFNQEDFEEGVLKQVDEAIAVKETQEAIEGWERELKAVDEDIRNAEEELRNNGKILQSLEQTSSTSYGAWKRMAAVKRQQENKLRQLKKLQAKQKSLHHKLGIGEVGEYDSTEGFAVNTTSGQLLEEDEDDENSQDGLQLPSTHETEQERLIKTGQMTPFGSVVLPSTSQTAARLQTTSYMKDAVPSTSKLSPSLTNSVFSLKQMPESDSDDEYVPDADELRDSWYEEQNTAHERRKAEVNKVGFKKRKKAELNVKYEEEEEGTTITIRKIKRPRDVMVKKVVDDGNEGLYRQRIRELRIKELMKKKGFESWEGSDTDEDDLPDVELDQGFKVPGKVWHKLYKYQKTGVKWLWELHCQQAGGIVGDEMGLGKTIQLIAFLAGLKYSNISTRNSSKQAGLGPVLIVCPVTVLHQWVSEFHKWWPEFRVAILHDTGSYQGPRKELVKKMCDCGGVLVTSYSGVRAHQEALLARKFDYVILDEGHKIRNPDAEITLACKQFRTCHRIILSGSPMQNNLKELWSLFDFVFPGKLGTLPVFMAEFSVPITMGGYANASDVQVQTAYKCACVLRDTINPYLLRRMKKDVQMSIDIPSKSEQVLFCRLTDEQRELYQQYLDSREVQSILAGNYKVFPGLIMLRKICNHPDLTSEAGSLLKAKQDALDAELGLAKDTDPAEGYGDWRRAGKMIVLEALLKMWKFQGHRVLVFSQTRQMLNILETFVVSRDYTYRRMDGSTSVASRQPLINKFNEDSSIFVFLLTTRVGGLGVNLVGANRVILYDPDWNPSTDTQARERAWRIGQKRDVTIYRLLTTGTIEEKIYHRQIFKQFLTNRVLKDPKQRRFFKTNDLYELFTLSDVKDKKEGTETSAIFAGTNCEVKVRPSKKKKKSRKGKEGRGTKLFKLGSGSKRSGKAKKQRAERVTASRVTPDTGAFSVDARDVQELSKGQSGSATNTSGGTDGDGGVGGSETGENIQCPGRSGDVCRSDTGGILRSEGNPRASDAAGGGAGGLVQSTVEGVEASKVFPSEERDALAACSAGGSDKNNGETAKPTKENTEKSLEAKSGVPGNSQTAQQTRDKLPELRLGSGNQAEIVPGPSHGELKSVSAASGQKKRKTRKRKLSNLSDDELKKKLRIKVKKKKRRRAKLDGQTVDHLDYHEMFSPEESGAEDLQQDKKETANQDELILKTLFSRTGVHSALKHDVIMESGDPDYTLVEMEANRVAKQAAQALKQSRQRCRSAASGVPTWTGVSGAAGLPGSPAPQRPRFGKRSAVTQPKPLERREEPKALFSGVAMGMTNADSEQSKPLHSSQLLAKMRARNNVVPGEGQAEGTNVQIPKTEYDELVVEIRNFIAFEAREFGTATTQEIVDAFGSKLPLNDSTVFRSLLKQICTFVRNQDTKTGVWKLKPEFC